MVGLVPDPAREHWRTSTGGRYGRWRLPAPPVSVIWTADRRRRRAIHRTALVACRPRRALRQLMAGAVKSGGLAPQITLRRILASCADWPARVRAATRMVSPGSSRRHEPDGRPLTAWLGLPVHGARNAAARVRDMVTQETWAVGIAPRPVASFLERPELDDVVWLPERGGGGFFADPFGLDGPDGAHRAGRGLCARDAARRDRGAAAGGRDREPGPNRARGASVVSVPDRGGRGDLLPAGELGRRPRDVAARDPIP